MRGISITVERVGRLGEERRECIDDLATDAARGRNGGSMTLAGIYKKRLLQVVSMATQVTTTRRLHRYKLAQRGRREVEGWRTRWASNEPMIWGWSRDAHESIMPGNFLRVSWFCRFKTDVHAAVWYSKHQIARTSHTQEQRMPLAGSTDMVCLITLLLVARCHVFDVLVDTNHFFGGSFVAPGLCVNYSLQQQISASGHVQASCGSKVCR